MNVVTRLLPLPYRLRKVDYKSPDVLRALRISVEAILGAAILAQVTSLGLGLRFGHLTVTSGPQPVSQANDLRARRADSLEAGAQIASAHLFGVVPVSSAEAAPNVVTTQWVLTGTVATRDPNSGLAILGSNDDKTHLVAAGEEIAPEYKLAQVYSDHVTVVHAGEVMTVRIKRSVQGTASSLLASLGAQPAALADGTPTEASPEQARRPQNFVLADALLRPAPWHDASGNYAGMTLPGAVNGRMLNRYGFKKEDVITAVNGRPITNLVSQQKALKEMSRGVPAEVTVVRDGMPQQMSVILVDDGTL